MPQAIGGSWTRLSCFSANRKGPRATKQRHPGVHPVLPPPLYGSKCAPPAPNAPASDPPLPPPPKSCPQAQSPRQTLGQSLPHGIGWEKGWEPQAPGWSWFWSYTPALCVGSNAGARQGACVPGRMTRAEARGERLLLTPAPGQWEGGFPQSDAAETLLPRGR